MSTSTAASEAPRPHDPEVVDGLSGILATFNQAGVLSAADVHGGLRLARLTGCPEDDLAILGAAFAIRAPRFGHVFANLADLPSTVTDEDGRTVPLDPDVWPALEDWTLAIARSPLVSAVDGGGPLHLDEGRLYLDRYWRHEQRAADLIAARATAGESPPVTLTDAGRTALTTIFAGNAEQAIAARAALDTRLAVIAGGPGTGKTATIARLVGLLAAHGTVEGRPVRVAVAAPTGKAAARLGEALRESADDLSVPAGLIDVAAAQAVAPRTLHRLLGGRWGRTRMRHDDRNVLPFDMVIVDEVSMVPLATLTRLLEALSPNTALVLVGDPNQLASVEAGSVLDDIIQAGQTTALSPHVVTLTHNYRNDEGITRFATRLRAGDVDGALAVLGEAEGNAVSLVQPDRPGQWPSGEGALAGVRELLQRSAGAALSFGRAGENEAALKQTMSAKVLCAHRRGPDGVTAWNAAVEGWIMDVPWYHRPEWYAGRPVMASRNDYDLEVFNGDIGIVVRIDDELRVVIDGRDGAPIEHRRLGEVQTVHAMTVHKSQGSQFDDVVVVLPHQPSPILTRELLYTAVTRARRSVTIVGSEESLRRAIERPVSRASALTQRLSERMA